MDEMDDVRSTDALAAAWEARWRDREPDEHTSVAWPAPEAREVLASLVAALDAAASHGLPPAGAVGPADPRPQQGGQSANPSAQGPTMAIGATTGGHPAEQAVRRWAATGLPVDWLIAQLGELRDLLAEQGDRWPEPVLRRTVDRLVTVATETVLDAVHDAARTDPLTGVGNRRAMVEAARPAVAAACRSGNALAVVAIDVVGLKHRNDTEGHAAGDRALVDLAGALRSALRHSDQLFRVGGDEFVAVLPLVGPADVADIMARAGADGAPRFSWGLALVPDDGTNLAQLLAVADQRLYEARRAPRRPGDQAGSLVAGSAGTAYVAGGGGHRGPRRRRLGRRRRGPSPGGHHQPLVPAAPTT